MTSLARTTTRIVSKELALHLHLKPNTVSFPILSLLERCSSLRNLQQIHSLSVALGLIRFAYITSRILALYAVHNESNMCHARRLFDQIPTPTVFDWNTMIRGYWKSQEPEMSLWVYTRMRRESVAPNIRTFPFAIKACACLSSLSQTHGQLLKFGLNIDVYVSCSLIKCYSDLGSIELAYRVFKESTNKNVVCWTSLIAGFCDHGLVDEARKVFDVMLERNEVSWSVMIAGYVQNERHEEAIELFHELKDHQYVKITDGLLVSVLTASASSGALEVGKWIHLYIDSKHLEYGLELGTALVDFYAKCGLIESARKVFSQMPSKDVTAWSAMIMGLALNGHSDSAIVGFSDMLSSRIRPNAVTFVGVLTACNHGGLVDEGQAYFKDMSKVYALSPEIKHYGCMVDLLGRAGRIQEAEELVRSMPMEPDEVIWGSLLNGCLMHGHIELAAKVGRHVVELDPLHCGRYVGLANVFASMGRWERVLHVRKIMKERRVVATPGWSLIEMNGIGYRFLVDDHKHPYCKEIHRILSYLYNEMIYDRREV